MSEDGLAFTAGSVTLPAAHLCKLYSDNVSYFYGTVRRTESVTEKIQSKLYHFCAICCVIFAPAFQIFTGKTHKLYTWNYS